VLNVQNRRSQNNLHAIHKSGYQIRFSVSIWTVVAGESIVGPYAGLNAQRCRDFLITVLLGRRYCTYRKEKGIINIKCRNWNYYTQIMSADSSSEGCILYGKNTNHEFLSAELVSDKDKILSRWKECSEKCLMEGIIRN
jgi:hypothetical protein